MTVPPPQDRATIVVAGQSIAVTRADARSIQAGLLQALARVTTPFKDYLLQAARGDIVVEPNNVELGRWVLRDWQGRLAVYHRGPTEVTYHVADVVNEKGTWTVRDVVQGEIRIRRN